MYSLSPKQSQAFESNDSPSMAGSEETKSIAGSGITKSPEGFTQGNSGTSHNYSGKKAGNQQIPVVVINLTFSLPKRKRLVFCLKVK